MEKLAQVDIGDQFNSPFGKTIGLGGLVSIILSNAIIIAGIILLFLLIFGGISIIMGAGQGNPEKSAKGQKAVSSALIGFLLIFAVYWIIQIVEVIFGFSILQLSF